MTARGTERLTKRQLVYILKNGPQSLCPLSLSVQKKSTLLLAVRRGLQNERTRRIVLDWIDKAVEEHPKKKNPTPGMIRVMRNLQEGREPFCHIWGRSASGGATKTRVALIKAKLVTEDLSTLTDAGLDVLSSLPPSP